MTKRKTGTREWSEHSANLYLGCEHGCRYCYARERAMRYGQVKSAAEWERPRELKVTRDGSFRFRRKSGVIMFPTTHDITPRNVAQCAAFLEALLRPGNEVLVVSKAHLEVIEHLCQRLCHWRKQVEFRVTIGTADNDLAAYWEPNAPPVAERIQALDHARNAGYRVSISMEPMLDPDNAEAIVRNTFLHFRPETIWLGMMNKVRQRVQVKTLLDERMVHALEVQQFDEKIMDIVHELKDEPIIRWKDSIREVCARNGLDLPAH